MIRRSTAPLARLTLAVALIGSTLGCARDLGTSPEQPLLLGEGPMIATLEDELVLNETGATASGSIAIRLVNRSDRTISLLNCNGVYAYALERKEGHSWVRGWSGVWQGCLSPPIRIEPGQQRLDTLRIVAGRHGSNLYPQFDRADPSGRYRVILLSAYLDYDHDGPPWGTELPRELAASNEFDLRLARKDRSDSPAGGPREE